MERVFRDSTRQSKRRSRRYQRPQPPRSRRAWARTRRRGGTWELRACVTVVVGCGGRTGAAVAPKWIRVSLLSPGYPRAYHERYETSFYVTLQTNPRLPLPSPSPHPITAHLPPFYTSPLPFYPSPLPFTPHLPPFYPSPLPGVSNLLRSSGKDRDTSAPALSPVPHTPTSQHHPHTIHHPNSTHQPQARSMPSFMFRSGHISPTSGHIPTPISTPSLPLSYLFPTSTPSTPFLPLANIGYLLPQFLSPLNH